MSKKKNSNLESICGWMKLKKKKRKTGINFFAIVASAEFYQEGGGPVCN